MNQFYWNIDIYYLILFFWHFEADLFSVSLFICWLTIVDGRYLLLCSSSLVYPLQIFLKTVLYCSKSNGSFTLYPFNVGNSLSRISSCKTVNAYLFYVQYEMYIIFLNFNSERDWYKRRSHFNHCERGNTFNKNSITY